jgi:carboxyl-terminal processing protease
MYYTPSGRSIQASGIEPDVEVKFIPPVEEDGKDKGRMVREKDLKGHLPGESGEELDADKRTEEKENDKRAKQLLEKDNQIRQALQLLQTWNIFSQMKTGS